MQFCFLANTKQERVQCVRHRKRAGCMRKEEPGASQANKEAGELC